MNRSTIRGKVSRRLTAKAARLGALILLAVSLQELGLAQTYTIADLGSNAWSYSEAHGINGSGYVVGEYEASSVFYVSAFLCESGQMTDLGHLNGMPYTVAYGVNATNDVVGESNTSKSTHAFVYSKGAMTDLGTLGANNVSGYSSAHAINTDGQIVGESSISFNQVGTIHAVLYNGGSKTDLGALGGDYSSASAINNSGGVVGESDVVNQGVTNVHAFIYRNGTMSDLETLGGGYSSARGINDSGVIVGEAETLVGGTLYVHAFIYRNGTMSDLGTLGGTVSSASAINTAGQVIGYATDTNELSNAFLYNGSKMVNLNDFIPADSGWTNLSSADAINDAGQIAGSGYLADGSYHAYLLTPAVALRIAITNPTANATFAAPASFPVSASVSDPDGTVTNVQFLVNGNVIGNSPSAPYGASANNLSAGTYTLTAVASDNARLTAANSITVTVNNNTPAPVTISNPAFSSNGFSFSFDTRLGFTYEAQFESPLGGINNWVTLTNTTGSDVIVRVTDTNMTHAQGLYRVVAH